MSMIYKYFVALLSVGLLFPGMISSQILFETPGVDSEHPWIIGFEEDGRDMLMVIWQELDSPTYTNLAFTKRENKPGATWTPIVELFPSSRVSKLPCMAVGPDKIVHLTWAWGNSKAQRYVRHGYYKNKKWYGGETVKEHPGNEQHPSVSILDNNTVNIAYNLQIPPYDDPEDYYINVNFWTLTPGVHDGWSTREEDKPGSKISRNFGAKDRAMNPDLFSKGRKTYCVWQEGTSRGKQIKFAEKIDNGIWSQPVVVSRESEDGGLPSWPRVAIDSFYNVHIFYGTTKRDYKYRARIFGKWTKIFFVNKGIREFCNMEIDENDTLHAGYINTLKNVVAYSYKSAYNLKKWPQAVPVGKNFWEAGKVCLYPDNKGSVHVVWNAHRTSASHTNDVYYRQVDAEVDTTTGYPDAGFTIQPSSPVIGSEVTFSASYPGGDSYHWKLSCEDYSDGVFPSGHTFKYTFEQEGQFEITLAVVNSAGDMVGTGKKTITVLNAPRPPNNVQVRTGILNRGFISYHYLNKISWEKNPENNTIGDPELYRIHKREKGRVEWTAIGAVPGDTYFFYDPQGYSSSEQSSQYEYGVSVKITGLEAESPVAVPAGIHNIAHLIRNIINR